MDFYTNACEQFESAQILASSEKYRVAVTLLCLAGELFLKSLVELKYPGHSLLNTHDIVGLGRVIKDDVDYKTLAPHLAFLRKYLNDSRYPFDHTVYSFDFYEECRASTLAIKQSVETAYSKIPVVDRLKANFGQDKVVDKSDDVK